MGLWGWLGGGRGGRGIVRLGLFRGRERGTFDEPGGGMSGKGDTREGGKFLGGGIGLVGGWDEGKFLGGGVGFGLWLWDGKTGGIME